MEAAQAQLEGIDDEELKAVSSSLLWAHSFAKSALAAHEASAAKKAKEAELEAEAAAAAAAAAEAEKEDE